jgi:hypothetical protein
MITMPGLVGHQKYLESFEMSCWRREDGKGRDDKEEDISS